MGDYIKEYNKIQWYADEINELNPGSTCFVKTDTVSKQRRILFEKFYICLNTLKQRFIEGCRKVIGLDGCFLKGVCKG